MQAIVHSSGCDASNHSYSRDRGLISNLPIPYCANYLLHVDFIISLHRFDGCDGCVVHTCGVSRFTPAFLRSKKITGQQTVNRFLEEWCKHDGTSKEVHSDEDVRSGVIPPATRECWMP